MTNTPSSRTVSAIAVVDLGNELLTRGVIDSKVLNNLGADFLHCFKQWKGQQTIQEKRLPEHLLISLWQAADTSCATPDLGLNIGAKVNDDAKGLLVNWLAQSETLAHAFDIFSQNIHLLNPSEHWEKMSEENGVKLLFSFSSPHYPAMATDRSMAALVSWASALKGAKITPVAAKFRSPRPESLAPYQALFGHNLLFSQAENSLVFEHNVFDSKLQTSNPYLRELLSKQANQLSQSIGLEPTAMAKVNVLLTQDLARFCQIGAVCESMHLSRSTLYRKLKHEGTSFTELVKVARIQALKKEIRQKQQHEAIAETLGFQDSSSYFRFRKSIQHDSD